MNMDIKQWINDIVEKLKNTFQDRLIFIGIQGSYNRGEETPESDIDLVVILDKLKFNDLKTYRYIIDSMSYKEKACGFISGKYELKKWSKSDLFQFFYDTKPLLGRLDSIIETPQREDIKKSIKIGAENIYHAAVHSFVHSNNYNEDLISLYKMTFFVLQAKYFIKENKYISTKKQLLTVVYGIDKEILNICINKQDIANCTKEEIEELYNKLIIWSAGNI